jgi:hypothetical protein
MRHCKLGGMQRPTHRVKRALLHQIGGEQLQRAGQVPHGLLQAAGPRRVHGRPQRAPHMAPSRQQLPDQLLRHESSDSRDCDCGSHACARVVRPSRCWSGARAERPSDAGPVLARGGSGLDAGVGMYRARGRRGEVIAGESRCGFGSLCSATGRGCICTSQLGYHRLGNGEVQEPAVSSEAPFHRGVGTQQSAQLRGLQQAATHRFAPPRRGRAIKDFAIYGHAKAACFAGQLPAKQLAAGCCQLSNPGMRQLAANRHTSA